MTAITYERKPLWLAGTLAAVLSATANMILYLVELAMGAILWNMLSPGTGFPLSLQRVISVSLAGAVGGTLLLWALQRTVRNPVRAFRVIAGVILVASFAAPMRIPTATPYMAIALSLMHTVVAASTVWALTMWARSSRKEDGTQVI